MVDASLITNLLGSQKLSADEIANLISQKSPIPVPVGVVQGVLDQLVAKGTIHKVEENGQTYYTL